MFVPDGFDPPSGLETDLFRLEPLGPEHNERDYEAWSSSIEHILASPGYGAGSRWPRPMSLEENLADLERHARDFADRTGFTYSVLDGDDVIGCVYVYPSRDETHDARVQSWVRASRSDLDAPLRRPSPVGSRAPGRSSGRSTRRLSTESRAATSTSREDRCCCERAEQVESEAARAHRVDEDEEAAGNDDRGHTAERDERGTAQALAGVPWRPTSLVERPVRELGGEEQAQGDHRHRDIERRVVDGELDGVRSSDERNGQWDERRPAEDDRGHEGEERDDRDARPRLLEGAVSAREGNRCDREEADDAADRGDYARAAGRA